MNKIHRDSFPPNDPYINGPNKGRQKWRIAENSVLKEFNHDDTNFRTGKIIFNKNPSSEKWKNELIKIQGRKCCYCEKPINTGDLEHYRPKKAWQQFKGDPVERPGYYWLAYRWKNILLACKECNETKTKGNLFPIDGPRAFSPACNLNIENAILINPYEEEPTQSISYYKSDPISKNDRGRQTIDLLDLKNRNDLAAIRKDRYYIFSYAKFIVDAAEKGEIELCKADFLNLKEKIRISQKEKQPFAGMINENIKIGHL